MLEDYHKICKTKQKNDGLIGGAIAHSARGHI